MTVERVLDDAIAHIQDTKRTVTVALAQFELSEELPTYRSLNIAKAVARDFQRMAAESMEYIRRNREKGDCRLIEYSASYKPDEHEVEYLRVGTDALGAVLRKVPQPSSIALLGDVDAFVEAVRFYILILSASPKRAVLFRRYGRTKELRRSRNIVMRLAGSRYERLSEPTFQFDANVDAVLFGEYIFILRKADFHHIFRYYELLRETATEALEAIRKRVPIRNFEAFQDSCLGHLQKIAKLRNIIEKPYFEAITMEAMKKTIKEFGLDIIVERHNGTEKLVFDEANRWAILNLLDDDYLGSMMTGVKYETNSKRALV